MGAFTRHYHLTIVSLLNGNLTSNELLLKGIFQVFLILGHLLLLWIEVQHEEHVAEGD